MRTIILLAAALVALPACKDEPASTPTPAPESTQGPAPTAQAPPKSSAPKAEATPEPTAPVPDPKPEPIELSNPKATKDTEKPALGTLPEGVGVAVGEKAPDFTVKDASGEPVSLAGLVQNGPILLVFYRGGW